MLPATFLVGNRGSDAKPRRKKLEEIDLVLRLAWKPDVKPGGKKLQEIDLF